DLPEQGRDETQAIIQHSRENYSLVKSSVETHIGKQYDGDIKTTITLPSQDKHEPKTTVETKAPAEKKEVKTPEKPHKSSVSPSIVGGAAIKGSEVVQKPKSRRRRHRKKKVETLKENTEQVIFLHRNE
ncbi:MAG: hypothetical protein ACHQT9_04250, partial [Candidatus Saccharimonadales bacterium]